MKLSVNECCWKCDRCVTRKNPPVQSRAPLRSYLVGAPMERIRIDVKSLLPQTTRGNKYILVVCDCFTKWTEAYAIPNQESATIIKKVVDELVCRYGAPLQIHSDQGHKFEARTFQQMCDFLGIHKTRTTSMRPQSNGNVERFDRCLATMFTMYCEQEQHKWDEYLPQLLMVYRSSMHSSTHLTPDYDGIWKRDHLAILSGYCQTWWWRWN